MVLDKRNTNSRKAALTVMAFDGDEFTAEYLALAVGMSYSQASVVLNVMEACQLVKARLDDYPDHGGARQIYWSRVLPRGVDWANNQGMLEP